MTVVAFASRFMVEAGRARMAAQNASAAGHDPASAVAPFVNYAIRFYGAGTDVIAAELMITEAEAYNARARTDNLRGRK